MLIKSSKIRLNSAKRFKPVIIFFFPATIIPKIRQL